MSIENPAQEIDDETTEETTEETSEETTTEKESKETKEETKPEDKIVDPKVKASIDAAYKARDEALRKLAAKEQAERTAETEKLKKEGKLEEAHARELADKDTEVATLKATNTELEKTITRLTRDASVKDSLSAYDFRSPKARDVATSDITKLLKKNEDGEWIGKDGRSIDDLAKAYLENEDNTWLLKPAKNTGTGNTKTKTDSTQKTQSTSLFGRPQSEVIADVAARVERRNNRR
jgi:hypothetical protein